MSLIKNAFNICIYKTSNNKKKLKGDTRVYRVLKLLLDFNWRYGPLNKPLNNDPNVVQNLTADHFSTTVSSTCNVELLAGSILNVEKWHMGHFSTGSTFNVSPADNIINEQYILLHARPVFYMKSARKQIDSSSMSFTEMSNKLVLRCVLQNSTQHIYCCLQH